MEYLKFIPAFFAGLLTLLYGEWSALLTAIGKFVTVLTPVQDLATPKEDEELKFSSPTLK
jgi:hypothetical protein